jgi:D-serine deaminase-like pyridoxal phosphate-dependent protein
MLYGLLDDSVVTTLDTPAVVADLDRVDARIARMAGLMADRGVALRPHAKTHKSVGFARRQIEAGAVGLTVATIGEAEVFADAGFDDLFIAYPVIAQGPKAARLRASPSDARCRSAPTPWSGWSRWRGRWRGRVGRSRS